MSENTPAPGWYPAPHANNEQRYWDGTQWLEPAAPAAPVAPAQPAKKSKKGWIIAGAIAAAVIVIGGIGSALGLGNKGQPASSPVETSVSEPEATPAPVVETEAPPAEPEEAPAPAQPEVPAEFVSALKKAEMYSSVMYMSKAGLYDQLTSEYGEKFSPEAAQYAVDNVKADWNANALAKAKTYQEQMAMSPEAIRDQLTSEYGEKFTQEEADFAIANLNG
ncbi:Ltp family lipoprotein [Microbacterium resistens]|nr:Ltp family lipoprotein [Microbacterium resistens]